MPFYLPNPPSALFVDGGGGGLASGGAVVIAHHIRQGEQAKERADKNHKKSKDHFIASGRYLAMPKTGYAPTWQHWELLLKTKVNLSTGRASELMQLADGRKDLQQIRDGKAQSVAQLRAERSSSLQDECSEEQIPGGAARSFALEQSFIQQEGRDLEAKLGLRLIDIGFKSLARDLHPDKGGSREAMTRLNKVRERLRANV
jgi:hypothetical protein